MFVELPVRVGDEDEGLRDFCGVDGGLDLFEASEDGIILFLEEVAAHEGELDDVAPFLGMGAVGGLFEEWRCFIDLVGVGEPEAGHCGAASGEDFVGGSGFS